MPTPLDHGIEGVQAALQLAGRGGCRDRPALPKLLLRHWQAE